MSAHVVTTALTLAGASAAPTLIIRVWEDDVKVSRRSQPKAAAGVAAARSKEVAKSCFHKGKAASTMLKIPRWELADKLESKGDTSFPSFRQDTIRPLRPSPESSANM
mmetsp:Transcript_11370/g.26188  ORF Transcript_11370/g.26188 Transcript_11370/m.26188 type:complete len:108 (+) Transcript_11370:381-704(+)